MSWDVELIDDRDNNPTPLGEWNYTHNTNRMIAAALESACDKVPDHWLVGPTWWDRLVGMSGPEGGAYLTRIANALAADPERFIAMNPENGWGSYDSLLPLLREMAASVPEWPCHWEACG
jgi:hypothetical protein